MDNHYTKCISCRLYRNLSVYYFKYTFMPRREITYLLDVIVFHRFPIQQAHLKQVYSDGLILK